MCIYLAATGFLARADLKKHAYAGLPPSENHASQGKNVRTNMRNSAFPRALTQILTHYKVTYIYLRPLLKAVAFWCLKYPCGHRQVTGNTSLLNEIFQPGLSPVINPSKKQVVSNLGSYIFVQFGNIFQHLWLFS